MAMEMEAERVPVVLGSNCTVNVVEPEVAATGEAGVAVTEKSSASVPDRATLGVPLRLKSAEPVFLIVKVRETVPPTTSALPKSVWSVVEGMTSPFAMVALLPSTLIDGAIPVPWMEKV